MSLSPRPGARPPFSPTTCCQWAWARSVTTCTPTSSTTPSGWRSGSLCCAPPVSGPASASPTPGRSTLQVWEENEFWIELSWRIDPDGQLGIRRHHESRRRPGERLSVDEYYGYIFERSVPGLPEAAAAEGVTPLQYMRRYGAFEIHSKVGAVFE